MLLSEQPSTGGQLQKPTADKNSHMLLPWDKPDDGVCVSAGNSVREMEIECIKYEIYIDFEYLLIKDKVII